MSSYPKDLAALVREHVATTAGSRLPLGLLTHIVESAYFSSMRTDESRVTLCSLAFADPDNPDPNPPPFIRDHRPRFFPLKRPLPLTVSTIAKLAPIARTSALALAVHGTASKSPYVWGLVDQEIHQRRTRVFEDDASFGRPGLFELEVHGIGHVGAYSRSHFIGSLRADRLVTGRLDALREGEVFDIIFDAALEAHGTIAARLGHPFDLMPDENNAASDLLVKAVESWLGTLCRILHRIQRYEHGGALLLLPTRGTRDLSVKHAMSYSRLTETLVSRVTATAAAEHAEGHFEETLAAGQAPNSAHLVRAREFGGDGEDATYALDGAVAFVAALSQVDGLILMGPGLNVRGFGVEITVRNGPKYVYLADRATIAGRALAGVEVSHFGTRHRSMFRYCNAHPGSVGFVISQDGDIRAITKVGRMLVMWENLNLYQYEREALAKRATRSAKRKRK